MEMDEEYIDNVKNLIEQKDAENVRKIYAATSDIPDATVFAMSPPMIAGYGMGNGFELYLQDKAGGNIAAFKAVSYTHLHISYC